MSNPRIIAPDGVVHEMRYTETPKYLQIETNVACNAKCPFCPYSHMDRGPKVMEDWIWKKIVDDTRGLGVTYRPFLINEPLSEKRLPEIIRYIKQDATARVEINSNGGLLTETRGRAILEAGIDLVRLSIDGFSPETHGQARVGVNYKAVVENANRFLELRNAGGYKTIVEVRCIDIPANRHEHKAYIEYWTPRADKVLIVPLYQWPWSGQTAPVLKPCLKILDEIFFYTSGQSPICCWDEAGRGIVGDVKTQSVLEIWNGAEMKAMRTLLNKGRRDLIALCSRCNAYQDVAFDGFEKPPAVAVVPSKNSGTVGLVAAPGNGAADSD